MCGMGKGFVASFHITLFSILNGLNRPEMQRMYIFFYFSKINYSPKYMFSHLSGALMTSSADSGSWILSDGLSKKIPCRPLVLTQSSIGQKQSLVRPALSNAGALHRVVVGAEVLVVAVYLGVRSPPELWCPNLCSLHHDRRNVSGLSLKTGLRHACQNLTIFN